MRIAGSVAILTGASSGIGAATAWELARRGAQVVLAARRAAELEELAGRIRARGGTALAVPTDVARTEDVEALVSATIAAYGRVDVLVNNAGIGTTASLLEATDEEFERIVRVNLLGPARCARAVLPYMRGQGGGVIVNVGSVAGEIAGPGPYSVTKFALRGFSDSLRREARAFGVAVVLVEPGFIRTPMTAGLRVPMVGPGAVARAIAGGIERPRRRIIVPWPYAPLVYAGKLLPGLVDAVTGLAVRWRRHAARPGRRR